MSADDSFPIFTLLWISEIFFCFNVFESKSYIAFSSDLVKITIQPDCSKSSTPANWLPNQPVIMPAPRTFPLLQERLNYINQNCNGMSWYLAFQEPKQECLNEINCENDNNC